MMCNTSTRVRSWYELGVTHAETGAIARARECLQQVLELRPTHGVARARLEELERQTP